MSFRTQQHPTLLRLSDLCHQGDWTNRNLDIARIHLIELPTMMSHFELLNAALRGQMTEVKCLTKKGADINCQYQDSSTPRKYESNELAIHTLIIPNMNIFPNTMWFLYIYFSDWFSKQRKFIRNIFHKCNYTSRLDCRYHGHFRI